MIYTNKVMTRTGNIVATLKQHVSPVCKANTQLITHMDTTICCNLRVVDKYRRARLPRARPQDLCCNGAKSAHFDFIDIACRQATLA